ncbi:MAG: hypothetical protein QM752_00320 [Gammaproteobacteria bacterium]
MQAAWVACWNGISVSNYERSKSFYVKILGALDYHLLMEVAGFMGFGIKGGNSPIVSFWMHEDKTKLLLGMHTAFTATNRKMVDNFLTSCAPP